MGLCKVKKGWQFAKAYLRFKAAQERYLIHLLFSPFYMLADWMGNQDSLFWNIWGADIYAVTNFLEGMALGEPFFIDNLLDFIADPSLGNVPILGPLLVGAWEANVEAYNNPNLDTICKAVEADLTVALFALTIAEAAGVGKGTPAANELNRPYIRDAVCDQVEANAPRAADGRPIDPNTRMPIDGKPDLGHKPGHEFWREKAKAEAEGSTQKEFNDRMNDPNLYQLEDPKSNRSHRYEKN
jgi:hypothetical protein